MKLKKILLVWNCWGPEPQVPPIDIQVASSSQIFQAFGYPKKTVQGGVAEGKIQAELPCGWFQIDGTCPEGLWAECGYSGTAIWGKDSPIVYGMMVARKRDNDTKIAYMIPSQGLENAIAHLRLLEQLPAPSPPDDNDNLWQVYLSVYQRCCPDDWEQSHSVPETLCEIFRQLNDMPNAKIEDLAVSIERKYEFVARLLVESGSSLTEAQKDGLRAWGKHWLPEFSCLIDCLQPAKADEPNQLTAKDPCLVVQISPNYLPYITQAFFIPDTEMYKADDETTWKEIFCWDFEQRKETSEELEPLSASDTSEALEQKIRQRLAGYITTCKKRHHKDGGFRIELILPRSLMNQPIERWELEVGGYQGSIVLASSFPVVIRSYDRTTDEYQEDLGDQWEQHWKRVKANQQQMAVNRLAAFPAKAKAPQIRAGHTKSHIVGVKISDVLQRSSEEAFFISMLGSATSVAVWLRRSPPNEEGLDDAASSRNLVLDHLDAFLACLVGNMPLEALQVRAQAIAASIEPDETNYMVGHHLSLLWENPNLLPPVPPKHVTE
ncbi:MAG: hypothetical protein HC810_06130 [Acaryochloridaceae cyanobacterium RL_2_7]|nr:hypothetical protein [Acaryochloridaceae cyanobacterium RL_2_7]